MSSQVHNPTGTHGPRRPVGWTVLAGVLVLGFLLAKPHLDEWTGVPAQSIDDDSVPASTDVSDEDRGESSWLTEVRPGVFESPAGLVYGPGSAEGHRIDHILRHAVDDPDRPVHGVFDGGREEILALLDEAYEIATERGPPVEVEQDGERTVYTIDMGRRVGFVGGESGRRSGHPDATHIRLVLEDRSVITAFPLRP